MLFVALTLAGLLGLFSIDVARRLLRAPTLPSLPLAFLVAVVLESVLLNFLSLGHAVGRVGILASHAGVFAGWAFQTLRRSPREALATVFRHARGLAKALGRSPLAWLFVPLFAVLYLVAIRYAPSNYDSLSYHLPRVFYWMEHRSLAFYPTANARQNETGPGAELLILAMQAVSESDVLANAVQTTAYLVVVIAVGQLVRALRPPRLLGRLLVVVFATAPMFVLQATTAQNDLCAAVATLAILSSVRKWVFAAPASPRHIGAREGASIGLALGGAYLIKPTALVFALPFLAVFSVSFVRALLRPGAPRGRRLWALVTASLAGLVACGPHLLRKHAYQGMFGRAEAVLAYPLTSDWFRARRVLNWLFCLAHHIPSPGFIARLKSLFFWALAHDPPDPRLDTDTGRLDGFYEGGGLRFHEDLVGAPIQLVSAMVLFALGLVLLTLVARSKRFQIRRVLTLGLCPLAGWLIFGWVVRNNPWIARYHTAWVPTAVLCAAAACQAARESRAARAFLTAVVGAAACFSFAYATAAVAGSELRPVTAQLFFQPMSRNHTYYAAAPSVEETDDHVLQVAARLACNRIADAPGYDDVEYPLLWRAHWMGIRIDRAPAGLDRACLLYAPGGVLEDLDLGGRGWVPVAPGELTLFRPSDGRLTP